MFIAYYFSHFPFATLKNLPIFAAVFMIYDCLINYIDYGI